MELHFCSQCGISIPDADFAASRAPDGRTLCAEHRPRAPEGSGGRAAGPGGGGGASSDGPEVELLFCANCRVSIPVVDVESGRARKEFGSVLCALCSEADPGERSARRKAVEAEMAVDAASSDPVALRHCATCGASVPQGHIVTGRARVDGDRVVCERCREAVPAAGAGAGTWVLVGLLVVACLAAGFFGTEYVQNRRKPAVSPETSEAIRALRADLNSRLAAVEEAVRGGGDEGRAALEDSISRVRDQISGDLVALRSDLADLGSELRTADGDAGQRVAKLEGQVANMQEMLRGLAARPAVEVRPAPGPSTPPPDGPPVPPNMGPEAGGPKAPDVPVVPAPDPALTKLRKDFLQDPDPGTRYAAALELIKLRDLGSIPLFARGVTEDDNVIVRRAAANGLGTFRAWNGVPALIQALEDRESYVAQRANFALQSITGQDFGVNIEQSARERKTKAAAATKWWEKNKDSPPDGVSLESVELPKK